MVRRHEGYLAFEYNVKTEDGQNLKIHRMQYSESNEKPKPVMLLQHGWGMSSDGFVLRGPGKDLGKLNSYTDSTIINPKFATFYGIHCEKTLLNFDFFTNSDNSFKNFTYLKKFFKFCPSL